MAETTQSLQPVPRTCPLPASQCYPNPYGETKFLTKKNRGKSLHGQFRRDERYGFPNRKGTGNGARAEIFADASDLIKRACIE